MSLVPFVTDFLGKNYHEPMAVALYGLDLTLCSTGFYFLRGELIRQSGSDSEMIEYHERIQRMPYREFSICSRCRWLTFPSTLRFLFLY
jgi:uncharacterized membrane protein